MNFRYLLALLALGVISSSCNKSSSSDSSATTTYSYAGAGSNYAASLASDGTFRITESDSGLTVNGTYTTLTSGFLELTVSSASITSGTAPSAGDKAYAINVPGYVFILKPLGSNTQVITMLASGTCPSSNLNLNWIVTNSADGSNNSTSDRFGTFTWAAASGLTALPTRYALSAPTTNMGAGTVGTFTCSSGIGTAGNAKMFLTASGGALVNTDTTSTTASQFILAMPTAAISSATSLAGSYAGLIFDESSSTKVKTVNSTVSGSTMTVNSISVATGASDGLITNGTIAMSAVDSPSAGFFTGTVTSGSSSSIACIAQVNASSSGKNIIFCIGVPPGGAATQLFTAVFVSK